MLDAERAQELPLLVAARGREDLGAAAPSDLESGQARTAGGRMDEDPLSRTEPPHLLQRIAGRDERDRQSRALLCGEPRRQRGRQRGQRRYVRAEAERRHGHDGLPDMKALDALSESDDDARALPPERARALGEVVGVIIESDEDIEEIQAGGAHLDGDLAAPWARRRRRPEGEPIQRAGRRDLEAKRLFLAPLAQRRRRRGLERTGDYPRDVAAVLAEGDLVLAISGEDLASERLHLTCQRGLRQIDPLALELRVLVANHLPEAPERRLRDRGRGLRRARRVAPLVTSHKPGGSASLSPAIAWTTLTTLHTPCRWACSSVASPGGEASSPAR